MDLCAQRCKSYLLLDYKEPDTDCLMQYSITKELSKKATNLFLYPYPPMTGSNAGFNMCCSQHIADIQVILGHKEENTNTFSCVKLHLSNRK